jgi:hypothetical protein
MSGIQILFLGMVFLINYASLLPSGPCDSPLVGGHTGAPDETSCTGCHGGIENTGPGSLELILSDTTFLYAPGELFDAKVIIRQSGRDKFGFVGLALNDFDNSTIGSFTIDDEVRTRKFMDGSRKYVSHTPCGADAIPPDSTSWTFHWQAPATNVGEITLYLAGLASNHSHSLAGDDTYTLSVRLAPDSMVLKVDAFSSPYKLRVWPSPAFDLIFYALENYRDDQIINFAEIWSANGYLNSSVTQPQNEISVSDLVPGMYHLRLYNKNQEILGQTTFVKM